MNNEMIKKLDNHQQGCFENIDKIKLEEKTKDLFKEIESSHIRVQEQKVYKKKLEELRYLI